MHNNIIYMYIISHNSSERRSIFNVSRWVEALQCYHVTACFTACIGVHSLAVQVDNTIQFRFQPGPL